MQEKNVFHIACQLASTSFFLRLLSAVFFHLVLGITRDETSSAFLWKLFCSPHKTLWSFSLVYISWSLDFQSRTCTQTVSGCLPVSFGKMIQASFLLLPAFVQLSDPVDSCLPHPTSVLGKVLLYFLTKGAVNILNHPAHIRWSSCSC